MRSVLIIIALFCLCSCNEKALPKPKSQLSLAYPKPIYQKTSKSCPYAFDMNKEGSVRFKKNCSAVIEYPSLNASLFLTYKKVEDNVTSLLEDAQKLTYEHVRKANDINEKVFINHPSKTFGMFYEVNGNAASQSQFYVTDSTNHFLTGSIYFNAKPNYDSIYPAAIYLKNDIRRLMESIEWIK